MIYSNLGKNASLKQGRKLGILYFTLRKDKCLKCLNLTKCLCWIKAMFIFSKNKWDLLKLKSLCTEEETINKTKRQSMDWEKTFANDVIDKGLASKIYKQLITFNSIKTNNSLKKWAKI